MTPRRRSTEEAGGDRPAHEDVEQLSIRPYARLLTMLGEQLIRNDRVALVELLKNSYDADATLAKVVFSGYGDELRSDRSSVLVLIDNGDGMTRDVILRHWLNPATAVKASRKHEDQRTSMNRAIQGEKGIGRFAMFKLGRAASVVTRARGSDSEFLIDFDLTLLDSKEAQKEQYLDELRVSLLEREPIVFDGNNEDGNESEHGTRIVIRDLRGEWGKQTAERAYADVTRMQPLVPARDLIAPVAGQEFRVEFWDDNAELPFRPEFENRLQILFEQRAVLRVHGIVDDTSGDLLLEINDEALSLNIFDDQMSALQVHKRYFGARPRVDDSQSLACGPFSFSFFVFDFAATVSPEHRLDRKEKGLVKDHRIYLYRDGVRVLPYGDPSDDWLQLDVIRGTQGASRVLGNDQTVGFVHISHSENPMLKDKTNREGLLDEGSAYSDFVAVLQVIAAYIRTQPYGRYVSGKERQREASLRRHQNLSSLLEDLRDNPLLPSRLESAVKEIYIAYKAEHDYFDLRIARTEDLAGVGLSVESASHDILVAGDTALQIAHSIVDYVAEQMPRNRKLRSELDVLADLLRFISSRLNDIQGLFVSTGQHKRHLDVGDYAERVGSMFRFVLEQSEIELSIAQPDGPLVVRTTEAALLQVLMNLIDNAIYWLNLRARQERNILVEIEAQASRVIVADDGPGVEPSDEPYIFEPFYTAKGVEGKGLGLYIARQVGIRSGFEVTLDQDLGMLPGANFVISFNERAS